MNLDCASGKDGMRVALHLTADDLPKLEALFRVVRELLELELRANAPEGVGGLAASTGDLSKNREAPSSDSDATAENIHDRPRAATPEDRADR